MIKRYYSKRFKSLDDRFWSKVEIKNLLGCWEWKAFKDKDGYGKIVIDKKPHIAHRYSYSLAHAQSNSNLVFDHTCRNTACVNPLHLEVVSIRENTTRGKTSKLNRNKSSRYTGVYWNKALKKWHAQIFINSKKIHLGYFDLEEDARDKYILEVNTLG